MNKKILLLCVALVLCLLLGGCTRTYDDWAGIYCDDIGGETVTSGVAENGRAVFYVPEEWICSRIDDFIFFASYEINSLDEVQIPGGQLYLAGWIAPYTEGVPQRSIEEIFDNVTVPADSAMFSAGLNNGAVYGREVYNIGTEGQPKYYLTLRPNEFTEIKLIDWQDRCGKELIKKIANSLTADSQ